MNSLISKATRLFSFYYEGFRDMSWWGRRVWVIIVIKLIVIFIILRFFFFKDFLGKRYDNDKQKSEYVMDQLLNSK